MKGPPEALEGQSERIDCRQCAIALGGRFHAQLERNAEIVIAQKSGAAEQGCSGREGAHAPGLVGCDFPRRAPVAVQIEQAVRLHVRNPGQAVLEPIGGAQRGEAQRIRRLEHEQCLLAFGKETIEFRRGTRDRIAGHDQPVDRRIVGHPEGAVYARRGQDQECGGYPRPRPQHAQEELNDLGRSGHTHTRAPFDRRGPRRRSMIA